ncbi:hypothetical protein NK553_05740 [Pseudomonas sp. ZM23]|uniref:Uncharacterized protein n=1 Tax=Pseudomonas triclosanedens TaxID=2961893 RepID=A0ABY6ZTU1_9PSED|nr:hypothetical protein [Pseudomonas triclosanedens]MCP8463449.1 hypothetical protein [Pseudomonas triclosanedens]MCP8469492.1 hypothetical protein [Pseudomonas triclosanedens]MCP8474250.1 hypothetical protein [Pseudomonas triclosanedens]WAI48362.1 hypothetical protein OU419_21760 [Pseudomonas triclosanedens]
MDAPASPAVIPQSEIALLANILALATRNMSSLSTLITRLSVELSHCPDPHLQRVGQRSLSDVDELSRALDTQWELIGSLSRFCPLLSRTPLARPALVTEIHITELPDRH